MINIFQFERQVKERIDQERKNDKDNKWRENYLGIDLVLNPCRVVRRNDPEVQEENNLLH